MSCCCHASVYSYALDFHDNALCGAYAAALIALLHLRSSQHLRSLVAYCMFLLLLNP